MTQLYPLFKREFLGYFRSPVAYVFTVIFLVAAFGCTFFIGDLYNSNQASLTTFFEFLPWLYLVLIPAVGMKLWAEERHSGTIELLLTLPVNMFEAVFAKFFAGWLFICIGLFLTFPLPATIAYLGEPDWGVVFTGYLGAFLMAGSFLGISCLASALTKNQVVAFVFGLLISFVLVLVGWGIFTDILAAVFPAQLVDAIANIGFMPHFTPIMNGVIDTRDLSYFLGVMGITVLLTIEVLHSKKAV